MEEDRSLKFILTGSSAKKLKRSRVDLMSGRAVVRHMHPFMASEIGKNFQLEKSLRLGLIPLVVNSPSPEEALKAYISLYIREEIQMEGFVRSLGNFSRFLESVSFSHASVLNASNISREGEVGRKAVEGYIGILEDLLLAFRIKVFTKRAKRKLAVHPKFYFADTGVFRSLRPSGPLDRTEEIEGVALEGLIAQHLRAWVDYRGRGDEIYYWRTRSGTEVDFVVYGKEGVWGIEVKNARRLRPSDFKGLKSFKDEYPSAKTILLYRGKDRLKKDGILCLPCKDFLVRLTPEKSLNVF